MICHKICLTLKQLLLIVLVFLSEGWLISACAPVIPTPSPSPSPTVEQLPASTVITGSVMDVALSAKVIFLSPPTPWEIAITDQTELLSEGGEKIALRDIWPGAQIRATGEVKGVWTMIASQVVLLTPGGKP